MKSAAAVAVLLLLLAGCENPDIALGASISDDGFRPTLGISGGALSVVVRP